MAPAWIAILLAGCMTTEPEEGTPTPSAGTNSETKTTLQARFFLPDGSPAAQATATWIPYCTGCEASTTVVGPDGTIPDSGIASGYLRLLLSHGSGNGLFQDSILSDGRRTTTLSDTLRPPSIVKGRIKMRRGDTLRTSLARILGVEFLGLAARDGRFRIERVPAGRYTLEASNSTIGYLPTFRTFRVGAGDSIDLGDIVLLNTLPPEAPEIRVQYDTAGRSVDLRWDLVDDGRIAEVRIRRGCRNSDVYESPYAHWQDTVFLPARATSMRDTFRAVSWIGNPDVDTCRWAIELVDSAGAVVSQGVTPSVVLPSPAVAFGFAPTWSMVASTPSGAYGLADWGSRLLLRNGPDGFPVVLDGGNWVPLFKDSSERIVQARGDSAWTWTRDCGTCDSGVLRLRRASGAVSQWRLAIPSADPELRMAEHDDRIWLGFFDDGAVDSSIPMPRIPKDSLLRGCEIVGAACTPGRSEKWRYGKSLPGSNFIDQSYRNVAESQGTGWTFDWMLSSLAIPGVLRLSSDTTKVVFQPSSGYGFVAMSAWNAGVWLASPWGLYRSLPGHPDRIGRVSFPNGAAARIWAAVLTPTRVAIDLGGAVYAFDPREEGASP